MAEIIIDLDEVESLCKPTRAEHLQDEVGQLREKLRQVKTSLDREVDSRVRAELKVEQLQELFFAARRWRLMRDTFTSMRNSIHPGLRGQALGTPRRDTRQAGATFWSILAELEMRLMECDQHGRPRRFASGHNLHSKGEHRNGQNEDRME